MQTSLADLFKLQSLNGLDLDPSVLWERLRINIILEGFNIARAVKERDPAPHPYRLGEDLLDRLVFLDQERRRKFGVSVVELTDRRCYYPNINPQTHEMDNYGSTLMRGRHATSSTTGQRGYLFNSRLSLNIIPDGEKVTIGKGDPVIVTSWLDESRVTLPS